MFRDHYAHAQSRKLLADMMMQVRIGCRYSDDPRVANGSGIPQCRYRSRNRGNRRLVLASRTSAMWRQL